MAFYSVVSINKVYIDYGAGTILGFSTGQVFDADPTLRSVQTLLRQNPPPIVAFTPGTAFTALPAGVPGGAATLDVGGTVPTAQLPTAAALDAEVAVWTKYSITAAAFTASAATEDIELFSLPAGGVIHAVKIKHSTAFSGGALSAMTLSVGIVGTLAKYATAFDVFQAVGATVQQLTSTVGTENHSAATSIRLAATATTDTLDNVTVGAVDVWVLVSTAV
jgi:hypothetical protein